MSNGYQVVRSVSITGPAEKIYSTMSDFNQFSSWSPWQEYDSKMSVSVSGAPGQEGANYSWSGNKKVGEGSMTFTKVEPAKKLALKVDFLRPFKDTSEVVWQIEPEGGNGCKVSWIMNGNYKNIVHKLIMKIINMDRMVGRDFERGLIKLKNRIELGK